MSTVRHVSPATLDIPSQRSCQMAVDKNDPRKDHKRTALLSPAQTHKIRSNDKCFGWLPVKKWITDIRADCPSALCVCDREAWENQLRALPCSLVSLISLLLVCSDLHTPLPCFQKALCLLPIMLHSLFTSLLVHFSLCPDYLKNKDCLLYNLVFPGPRT